MRSIELCAGHGGGLLGNLLLGHTTVCAVEREPACITSLRARQAQGYLPEFPIHDDVRTFDGRPWRGSVDVLSGGIPCQGFSGAGKQLGEFDPRNLWPDALRILKECRAPWFFLENVDRLTSFDYWGVILQDLASAGYDARWCVLSAGDVGAPHLRKRIWLLATDTDAFRQQRERGGGTGDVGGQAPADQGAGGEREWIRDAAGHLCADVADADQHTGEQWRASNAAEGTGGRDADRSDKRAGDMGHTHHARPQVRKGEPSDARSQQPSAIGAGGGSTQPDMGGMADGLANRLDQPGWWAVERGLPRVAGKQPHRADRLRGLGNGQVALCKAAAWKLLGGP